jgi:NADH:ubiquinone oxidoreductase subunit F (NADH-binding)
MNVTPPTGLPRLLAPGAADHHEHLARYGPLPELRRRVERNEFIAMVERSGLRGRGGGGFPMGRKLRAVADGRRPIVVANGTEGEPASAKDHVLLQHAPHLVVDGAVIAARAVGASEIHFVVDRGDHPARASLQQALAARTHDSLGLGEWRIVDVPSRYVAGEESALVNFLNGGEAKPISVPPRPYQRGVRGRATLVQNVETLAHLALVARFGAEWFGSVGTADEPGSVLTTVVGGVARPGVLELALGTPLTTVVDAADGASEPVGALLVGGYFGTWLDLATAEHLTLSHRALREAGATLGCGVIAVLPAASCGVVETGRVARYLASESAGQCGPCVHGLDAIATALEALAIGQAPRGTVATVERWLTDVAGRGACHMPDAAVVFVRSALSVFADDYMLHERRGPCPAVVAGPVLPLRHPSMRDRSWR